MSICVNCGVDADLMLAVKLNGNPVEDYCSDYECMEAAKTKVRSLKYQVRGMQASRMEAAVEGKNR